MKEYRVLKMYSAELKKEKRIYLYLPKGYGVSGKFYPVLYMHDGQNLFDNKTAYMNASWNIIDSFHENPEFNSNLPFPISSTFHGRDIMMPVAAHLSKGLEIFSIGNPKESVVILPDFEPKYSEKDRSK